MSLFAGAKGQYIDASGKVRAVSFSTKGEEMTLMVSPIPPFDLPIVDEIRVCSLSTALAFAKAKGLTVASQTEATSERLSTEATSKRLSTASDEDGKIEGLWLDPTETNPNIYYLFIPINVSNEIKDLLYNEETAPIKESGESRMDRFKRDRRAAVYLKKYVLYTYALNPSEFSPSSIFVIKDYDYKIAKLNKRLYIDGNKVMYTSDRKLIASSEKVKSNLLSYLNASLLNNRNKVMETANLKTIEEHYQNISDFRASENQLIFGSKEDIKKWTKEAKIISGATTISEKVDVSTPEPYYYRSFLIRDSIPMIIQNVKGGRIETAMQVAYKWLDLRVNAGYDAVVDEKEKKISYISYDVTDGKETKVKRETDSYAKVLKYENGTYAAILFFR